MAGHQSPLSRRFSSHGCTPSAFSPPERAREGSKYIMKLLCVTCRKPETASLKLLHCARCRLVQYCSAACQKRDYDGHKLVCKEAARRDRSLKSHGLDSGLKTNRAVWSWVEGLPGVLAHILCLAWKHRAHSPYFSIIGGRDGQVE